MLNKFKAAAAKAGVQATAFSQQVAREVQEGSSKTLISFKLENEVNFLAILLSHHADPCLQCTKAAKILQSFLADPNHPESALNAIPKEVLARARGFAIFTVLKVRGSRAWVVSPELTRAPTGWFRLVRQGRQRYRDCPLG